MKAWSLSFLVLLFFNACAENIVFPEKSNIVNVTRPPYSADNSGQTDVTQILIDAATFARNENRILYFPNGTYLVSSTVVYDTIYNYSHYTGEDYEKGTRGSDNAFVRYQGQSKTGTIIKLKDRCTGYESGKRKAVLSTIRRNYSNIGFNVEVNNLTINTGKGNPGAVGLKYNGSNTSAVRDVHIFSEDGLGHIGLDLIIHGPGYIKNVSVHGFDIGIDSESDASNWVLEHIILRNQNRVGLFNKEAPLTIRDLKSTNQVSAIQNREEGYVILLDSELKGIDVTEETAAIQNAMASHYDNYLFIRNVHVTGYPVSIQDGARSVHEKIIHEYSSHTPFTLGYQNTHSLNLPVKETPPVPWDPPETWVCVDEFGAVGNDTIDDTEAIQKALNSGASTVYAMTGHKYILRNTVTLGPDVRRINCMWAQFKIEGNLNDPAVPFFKVVPGNHKTVFIEKAHVWHFDGNAGKYTFVEHAAPNTLVLLDNHIHRGVTYRNTVPGTVLFTENTKGKVRGTPGEPYAFNFKDGIAYTRQLNPDGGRNVLNDGGLLWVLGFKSEDMFTRFTTINNGITEVLGGCSWIRAQLKKEAAIINHDSHVTACFFEAGPSDRNGFENLIEEKRAGNIRFVDKKQCPQKTTRTTPYVGSVVPMYHGYDREAVDRLLEEKFGL